MEGDDDAPAWQTSDAYSSPRPFRPSAAAARAESPPVARQLIPLLPGDILMQGSLHAAMWVGGVKPVVHAVTTRADGGGHTKGAIRQSDSLLRDNDEGGLRVFRYVTDPALGAKAAEFAIRWATDSDRYAAPAEDAFRVDETAMVRVLKTPYSERRHMRPVVRPALQAGWSVNALFRVIKAVARARDGAGLSPNHGVSCDQFVVFCYQAAALEAMHGGTLPKALIDQVRRDVAARRRSFDLRQWARVDDWGGDEDTPLADRRIAGGLWRDRAFAQEQKVFKSLKSAPDREFIATALGPLADRAAVVLPTPMRRDAKTSEIETLIRDLRERDSGFHELGRTRASPVGGVGIEPRV